MNFQSRGRSFSYALNGLWHVLRYEANARLHAIATILIIIMGIYRHIGQLQWLAITFAVGLVWVTETLNTAIERLCDYSCEEKWQPPIKIIKDVAAAAVLIASIVSLITFFFVFIF
jgi:diacylglycerol kinase